MKKCGFNIFFHEETWTFKFPYVWSVMNALSPSKVCRSLYNKATVRGIYLSLDILQSITVFLLVFTMMNGRWIHALGGGAPLVFSTRLLRSTRFLKAICYKKKTVEFLKKRCPSLSQISLYVKYNLNCVKF